MASETQVASTANLIRTGKASRILGCSPSYLLALVRGGKVAAQEIDGFHVYDRGVIEGLARARRQASTRTTDATIASVLRDSRVTVTAADLNRANKEHYATEEK